MFLCKNKAGEMAYLLEPPLAADDAYAITARLA
jgi:hypothetical protein